MYNHNNLRQDMSEHVNKTFGVKLASRRSNGPKLVPSYKLRVSAL